VGADVDNWRREIQVGKDGQYFGKEAAVENAHPANKPGAEKRRLNKRLESVGWALFLIMIGGIWLFPWLFPDKQVPEGTWLISAGAIMLGLNGARYLCGIKMSGTSIVLGLLAVALGVTDVLAVKVPFLPIVLVIIGVIIILKPLLHTSTREDEN
jgi:hypothetical protein